MPFVLEAPGTGAPPPPPPSTLVGAVGRSFGVVEVVEEDILALELVAEALPEGAGAATVVRTCEKTTVVVCLPGPRPIEVERRVVVIVRGLVAVSVLPVEL